MAKAQKEKLYTYMRRTRRITAKQAEDKFGTKNLRARINDLRNEGWDIVSVRNPKAPRTVIYQVRKSVD